MSEQSGWWWWWWECTSLTLPPGVNYVIPENLGYVWRGDSYVCFHLITIEDSSLHILFQKIFNACTITTVQREDWCKSSLLEMKDITSNIKIVNYMKNCLEDPSVLPTVILNKYMHGIHKRQGYFNFICGGDYLFSYISDMRLISPTTILHEGSQQIFVSASTVLFVAKAA